MRALGGTKNTPFRPAMSGSLGGLPAGNHAVQLGSVHRGLEALAQAGITEQPGNFREDFQMLLRGSFWHQQKISRLTGILVRRIKPWVGCAAEIPPPWAPSGP